MPESELEALQARQDIKDSNDFGESTSRTKKRKAAELNDIPDKRALIVVQKKEVSKGKKKEEERSKAANKNVVERRNIEEEGSPPQNDTKDVGDEEDGLSLLSAYA